MSSRSILVILLVVGGAFWRVQGSAPKPSAPFAEKPASSEYILKFWRTEQGLPQNSVTALAQTPDGYLWFGTRNGLVRFDGVRCTIFNRVNSPGFTSSRVTALSVDSGHLWIGFENGSLFEQTAAGFSAVATPKGSGRIQCIEPGGSNTLWIGTEKELFKVETRPKGGSNPAVSFLPGLSILALRADDKGTLWIGTAKGLWTLREGKLSAAAPQDYSISSLAISSGESIWIGGGQLGLLQVREEGAAPRRIWPVTDVAALCPSAGGFLWIASTDGMLRKLGPNSALSTTLEPAFRINCLFEDREGNLWIGTEDSGLAQLRRRRVTLYDAGSGAAARADPPVAVTERADGEVWIATQSGSIQRLIGGQLATLPRAPGFPDVGAFTCLCVSRFGGVWLGTRLDGLFYCDGSDALRLEKRGTASGISALFEDRQGRLWVASGQGALMLEDGLWTTLRSRTGRDAPALSGVTAFAQDRTGRVWIGTRDSGLLEWTRDGARQEQTAASAVLRDCRIETLYADPEGDLWIGTNRGLILRHNERFFSITMQHGLYDDMIYQILDDFRGHLWMGSNRGIFRADKEELHAFCESRLASIQCQPYGIAEGLASTESIGEAQPTSWKGANGQLWFATRKGLAAIDPASPQSPLRADAPLPVVIESGQVDDTPLKIEAASPLKVPAGYKRLRFRFTALSFIAPERIQFRYRLQGYSGDWITADDSRVASFTGVPPGDYRFQVIARNEDGLWGKAGAGLAISIAPLFWQTAWFKGTVAAGILGLIALAASERTAKRREMETLRLQITRDLHDDLGSNLGSIALLSEAVQKPDRGDLNRVRELVHEIHQIAHETLDSMRDAIWFVNPEQDSHADLAAHLQRIADSMLKNIPHAFLAKDGSRANKVPLDVKRAVVLVFKEVLHNVIRHSNATQVNISLDLGRGHMLLRVHDNGSGFDETEVRKGHGLKNLRQRADAIGGSLVIRSERNSGTTIELKVRFS